MKGKAQALGLYAMNMPTDVGGGGLSTIDTCFAEEQLGTTSDALIRRIFGQVYDMLLACEGAQLEEYLLPTVRGDKICAMAITEPGAGSDAANIGTTAEADGDSFVINGRKHFISDGDIADYAIVMTLHRPRKARPRGHHALLSRPRHAGFQRRARPGHDGAPRLWARGVGVRGLPGRRRQNPGPPGRGFRLIMSTISRVRLAHIGARSVGMAGRVLELSRAYANQRQQFGQPIGEFQMVQQMLADMATDIFAARSMVLNTAWEIDQGHDPRAKLSMVKLFASEMMGRVADQGSKSSAAWDSARRCRWSAFIATAGCSVFTMARPRFTVCSSRAKCSKTD